MVVTTAPRPMQFSGDAADHTSVLEAIYRGAGFERVMFAFVNQDKTHIEGRLGLGDDVDGLIEKFQYRMSKGGGPVAAALLARRTVVGDSTQDEIRNLARVFGCSYMGLYPIVVAGQVVGCIYMESRTDRTALKLVELRLLRQLRDALASAIRRMRCDPPE